MNSPKLTINDVDAKRRSLVSKRLENTPKKLKNRYLSAALGKASIRSAVRSFCLECIGWEREEVTKCTAYACPLYLYRPFRAK